MICKLRKILSICLLIVVVYTTISYAKSVKITSENLNSALNNLGSSNMYEISVSNNNINVKMKLDNSSYDMKYDITNKPTFIYEAIINKGMTYDEFEKVTNCSYPHMLAFMAVADVQGVENSEAMSYYMSSMLNGSHNLTSSKYIIMEPAEGVTVDKNGDSSIILKSEFGDRVMEYVNDVYKDKYTKTDSTYTYTIERKDVTETSCKIVYTLEVDTDAIYEELNENKVLEGNSKNENTTTKLPQTGANNSIISIVFIAIMIGLIVIGIKLSKYRDIK